MGAPEKIWYQSLNSRNRYLANLAPRAFPHPFLREKPWGRGWYLANLYDRGKGGGGGVRGLLLTRPHGLIKKKNLWYSGYLVTVPTALLPWVTLVPWFSRAAEATSGEARVTIKT